MSSPVLPNSAQQTNGQKIPQDALAPPVADLVKPDAEVSFECPECEHTCAVQWERLAQGLYCSICQSTFDIFPNRLQKRARRGPLEITFVCPRCRQSNTIPTVQAAKGATCSACQLELLPGPDNKLHDRASLKWIQQRNQTRPSAATSPGFGNARFRPDQVRLFMIVTGILLGLGLVIWTGSWLFYTPSIEEQATHLTQLCLAGKEAAWAVGEEDDQILEFKRWKIMHFASLSVALKRSSDWPVVTARMIEESARQKMLLVQMRSALVGQRSHTQIWRYDALLDAWFFDVRATLKNPHAAESLPRQASE